MEKLNKNMEENFKNALFINYGGLGDEILFLPAIEGFKKRFPDSKITLCLEKRAKGIKALTNLIDDVIEVDIKANGFKKYLNVLGMILKARKEKFDVVISSGKSPLVSVILYLTGIKRRSGYLTKTGFLLTDGIELDENQYAGNMYHDLILPFIEEDIDLAHPFVPNLKADSDYTLPPEIGEKGFVALHPGVSKMSINKGIFKCPKSETFWPEIIRGVLSRGKKLVLLGGSDDMEVIENIIKCEDIVKNLNFVNMYGKTKNLKDLMNIISAADTVICADSAPLHIAVGLNKNIITFFGPTNEEKLVPEKENIKVVVNKKIDCRPCLWHKRMVNCNQSSCLDINPSDILNLL